MSISDILLTLVLFLAPSVKGLYYEQEMFIFQTLVFIAFALFLYKNRSVKLNRPLDFAVLAFLAAYLLTLPGAADFREALLAVMRILAYFMIYLMVAAKARDDSGRIFVLRTVYLSGILMAVVTLLNLIGLLSTSGVWDGGIIHTTFEYKNAGALFLLVCTLVGVYLGQRTDSTKISVLIGIGNFLNLLLVIGTQSRAVWILSPVVYILLMPGLPAGKRTSATFKILIPLLSSIIISNWFLALLNEGAAGEALLPVIAGAVLAAGGIFGWLKLENRVTALKKLGPALISILVIAVLAVVFFRSSALQARLQTVSLADFSFQDRFVFFKDAWKIIGEHPFFGAGGRGWDILYLNIQSYGYYAENVHNDFLQVAVEAGFIGLLTFISVWVVFFLTGWRVYRRSEPVIKETLWLVLAAGAAVMLHSLFDFDLAHSALAFVLWSFFGIIRAADGKPFMDAGSKGPGKGALWRSPASLAVLAAGLLYSALSLSFFTGDRFFAKGEEMLELDDLPATRDYFEKARTVDPWKTNTLVSLAQINLAMFQRGDTTALDQAVNYAEKAIRARPNEPLSHSVYATALFYKGDYARSAAETEKFVALHPMLLAAYEELAARYVNIGVALMGQGVQQEAKDYLNKALQIPNMIDNRLKSVSSFELDLWRARNAEPVLAVSPRVKTYSGAAHLLLNDTGQGSELITTAAGELGEAATQPANPEIIIWQALALELSGRKDQSRTLLEQAAAQNPGIEQSYERVKNVIKKLN